MTVEPGRQLAGRYRVEDLVAERSGARTWRAVDQVLRRSVAIDVLAADAPRADALVSAARRAALIADTRFLRVLDAAQENGDVYVVREWARGEPLERVLAGGPLPPRRAAWVVREIAEALTVAHHAGIHHWRLFPSNIILTETGAVRIMGLATDAALEGLRYADSEAAVEDVRGLGRLLYAALVARWPGGAGSSLPAAPVEHGRLLRPRQVRAGVPRSLDEICDQILGETPRHHRPPLRTTEEVAAALAEAADLRSDIADPDATQAAAFSAADVTAHAPADGTRLFAPGTLGTMAGPPAVLPATRREGPLPGPAASTATADAPVGPGYNGPGPAEPRLADRGSRRWTGLIASLAVLVAAVVAFVVGFSVNSGSDADPADDRAAVQPRPPQPVEIAAVQAWDPYGENGENDDEAPLAADGDPSTSWTTMSYRRRPDFGGLKEGLGLIVDLGEPSDVAAVRVNVGGSGTDFEVRVAPGSDDGPPADLGGYQVQGRATGASGPTPVQLSRPVSTRYVLIWLTSLPPEDGSNYKGVVHEITVSG